MYIRHFRHFRQNPLIMSGAKAPFAKNPVRVLPKAGPQKTGPAEPQWFPENSFRFGAPKEESTERFPGDGDPDGSVMMNL